VFEKEKTFGNILDLNQFSYAASPFTCKSALFATPVATVAQPSSSTIAVHPQIVESSKQQ
jgi:hypothetical protein